MTSAIESLRPAGSPAADPLRREPAIPALCPFEDLRAALEHIGVTFADVAGDPSQACLYAWVTRTREVLYIGKMMSSKRSTEEHTWIKQFDAKRFSAGFPALAMRHRATQILLGPGAVKVDRLRDVLDDGWSGDSVEFALQNLDGTGDWTSDDYEMLMVRTVVNAGYLIGNAAGAGQWARPADDLRDVLGAVAVIESDALRVQVDDNYTPQLAELLVTEEG